MALGAPEKTRYLTEVLIELLQEVDPENFTWGQLVPALIEREATGAVALLTDEARTRVVLRPAAHDRAEQLLNELDRQPVREAREVLERHIDDHEAQDDPWPEGRLNAGIAHALLGDLEAAQRRLEEAVAILEGRGVGREEAQMAA